MPKMATALNNDDLAEANTDEKNKTVSSTNINKDEELDDLLDNALEDFDKKPPSKLDKECSEQCKGSQLPNVNVADPEQVSELTEEQEALFNEIFSAAGGSDGQGNFEDIMKNLMTGDPEILDQWKNMAEIIVPPEGSPSSIDETLQETLNNLEQNVQGLQEGMSDEDILHMLSGMKLNDEAASGNTPDMSFLPMMQNMMQSLMSKEVLYPSLKDISDKYPKWLEENSTKLTKKEADTYSKQYELMSVIVQEYESETDNDTEDDKKRRFERIMNVMQKMQELGQPPKDLVGDMPPGFDVDENGLPKLPGSPDQCMVM